MPEESTFTEKQVKITSDDKVSIYEESHVNRKESNDVHVMTDEEEKLDIKAKRVGSALEDLVTSAIDKGKLVARQKTGQLVRTIDSGPADLSASRDARDISRLGPMVENLARVFEATMSDVRKQDYEEQEKLLIGYRKLLQEQINLINSAISFAKRVK